MWIQSFVHLKNLVFFFNIFGSLAQTNLIFLDKIYDATKNEYSLVYSETNPIINLRRSYDIELYPVQELAQISNKFIKIKKPEENSGSLKLCFIFFKLL